MAGFSGAGSLSKMKYEETARPETMASPIAIFAATEVLLVMEDAAAEEELPEIDDSIPDQTEGSG